MVHGLNLTPEEKKLIKPTIYYILGHMRWSNIAVAFIGFGIVICIHGFYAVTKLDDLFLLQSLFFGALFIILGLNWWQSDMDRMLDQLKQHPELVDPSLAEGKKE